MTVCTKDKTKILSKVVVGDIINPAYVVLTDIGKTVERYILSSENMEGIAIENYVIMPNHIHIIVAYTGNDGSSGAPTPTNAIIPRLVSSLKRLVNKEVGHPIWQRGYYDHVIRGEEDYREIWSYIDNNPAHWRRTNTTPHNAAGTIRYATIGQLRYAGLFFCALSRNRHVNRDK